MQTYGTDRLRTHGHSMGPEILLPFYSSKQIRSWSFFRHLHPVPQKRPQLETLHRLPKNKLTCAHRHTTRVVPTLPMISTHKIESPIRSAATEFEYISLSKLKREIRRADLTGDEVFLCCMPRPALPVDQMQSMQGKNDDSSGIDQVRRKLPIAYTNGRRTEFPGRHSLQPGTSRVRGTTSTSTWKRPLNTP